MITGEMIKTLRLRKGLSTHQAAELIGTSQPTIWRWEASGVTSGRQEDAKELYKKLLGLPDNPKTFQTFEKRKRTKPKPPARDIITHAPTGQELKALRLARGYTQEVLGDLVGLSTQEISNIECGKNEPSEYTKAQLCEVFGIRYKKDAQKGCRTASGVRFG